MLSFNFNRPVSPHLQIYNPTVGLLLSISHRITGLIITLNLFLFFFGLKISLIIPNFNLLSNKINFCKLNSIFLFLLTALILSHIFTGCYHLKNSTFNDSFKFT